ncbi:MAG: Fe-S protein assembly chaperone HscA [Deltaproteobacteria bacterium]|nr:Fe-S protein assembly chaperone HscA [Deltaproteobacteria bacterium]
MERAVGIDLGTTYSLVATAGKGAARVLRDANGDGRFPSAAFFGRNGKDALGWDALHRAEHEDGDLLLSIKRFMGRGAHAARQDPGLRSFRLAAGDDRMVRFHVEGDRTVTPIELSARYLAALKARAEQDLGGPVTGAVITVPAYFDDAQRQATKDAGKLAGLNVLRLLAEPTAAAVAYGLDRPEHDNGRYVVFDLGGGTFDVSVLAFERGVFQVLATSGDTALGGDDFDLVLARMLLRDAGWDDPAGLPRVLLNQARAAAKAAKERFSTEERVEIVFAPEGGRPVRRTMTRQEFHVLVDPVLRRCRAPCEAAMRDAGLTGADLGGVILVGGSTRMPVVRAFVREFFGREPLLDANPDEVVAVGAALQADLLSGGDRDMLLLDVTPLSLGVETMGGVVDKIIPRNTSIPARARTTFTTYADGQTGMDFHVVQGEREKVEDCKSLARFKLSGIPPMAAGIGRVEVTYALDADGLLTVTARETTTGRTASVEVKPSYGLTDAEVEQMLVDSMDFAEQDMESRLLIEGRVEAQRIIDATRKALREDGAMLSAAERRSVEDVTAQLEVAKNARDRHEITRLIDALDHATAEFARRRMGASIQSALKDHSIREFT